MAYSRHEWVKSSNIYIYITTGGAELRCVAKVAESRAGSVVYVQYRNVDQDFRYLVEFVVFVDSTSLLMGGGNEALTGRKGRLAFREIGIP